MNAAKMPLMTALGADWWNDSGSPAELAEAVSLGAVGATSNPVIVYQGIKGNPDKWFPVLDRIVAENPSDHEDEITWKLIAELGRESAAQLTNVFNRTRGEKGYLSIQVSAKNYAHRDRMVAQAVELAALAPNIAIKAPATEQGIAAMEEMTARGIRVNATVSFSVAQAISVAEALDRGLKRAKRDGVPSETIRPYITLMIGRVDDHLKRVAEQQKITTTPGIIDWAGIAVFKQAHRIFQQRGYAGTLLAAAYRHQGHWSEIIGKSVLQTIPYTWWKKFNASEHVPTLTLDQPVDDAIVAELKAKFPDFSCAYEERGMPACDYVRYGATRHTLSQFLGGYADLVAVVRSRMLPL
jgi:transaldolase